VTTVADVDFDEAFEHLRGYAYRAAYRLVGSRGDAEDIAAETLTRAYARWATVRGHAEPWVVTTATNLALDLHRRTRTAGSRRHLLVEATAAPDQCLEYRLDLVRALAALPRRQREVVALRFLADYSEQTTATALGIDVGTVKSHTARALAHLRVLVLAEGASDAR
jgi:RNA polymerase sigma factor (sigma-70 family)